MATGHGGFIRDNAFLLAAMSLPVVVAAFFLLASVIPQWTVPAPAHDLVLRVARPYDTTPPKVVVDFNVRDGRVEATVRPAPTTGYVQPWALFLFDHDTGSVREIPFEVPDMAEDEAPRTIVVDALSGQRVSAQAAAPDGYALQTRTTGSSGLVGALFGMGRYRQNAALVNRGRFVSLDLPSPYGDPYQSPIYAVGWVVGEGQRSGG